MSNRRPKSIHSPFIAVIMGPTASGKTDLALRLAERLDGEIISADSMQIYQELDIGTAKPTTTERATIPHHLIDILDVSRSLDVYQYVDMATTTVMDVAARNKLPILAGGTGMYIRSFLYGLAPLPGDAELRAKLDRRYADADGFDRLKREMERLDPRAAERFANNKRKMIRALEVHTLTGKSIIDLQEATKLSLRWPVSAWYLKWDRDELKKRIRRRTVQMLESGWIDEARDAVEHGLLEAPTAWQALGYKIIAAHLSGELDRETMTDKIVTATWRLAKRQITWFERQHPEARTLTMPLDKAGFDQLIEAITQAQRQASMESSVNRK